MSDQVRDNPARSRFELDADGYLAFSDYRRDGAVLTISHTEVPAAIGGKGIGSKLVRGVLDLIRAEGLKVVPRCSFVRAYIERHPEYRDLLA